MGGPGSGPRKGQPRKKKYKSFREAAGYDDTPPFVPPIFPREVIDAVGVFEDEERDQTFPRTGNRKYTKHFVTLILDGIRRGGSIRIICDAVNLNERTYFHWVEQRPDFKALTRMANAQTLQDAETALYRIGIDQDNVLALIAIMNNKGREYGWGKGESIDVNLSIGGGINVQHILLSPEAIEAASRLEAATQQEEMDVIEGQFQEVPALPEPPQQEDLISE